MLENYFGKFGELESVKINKGKASAMKRNFGFVTFVESSSIIRATEIKNPYIAEINEFVNFNLGPPLIV